MQVKKYIFRIVIFLFPISLIGQTTYTIQGSKEYQMLERLEIKTNNVDLMLSTAKPYSRKYAVAAVELIDSLNRNKQRGGYPLSDIDKYNMQRFLMNNSEWAKPRAAFQSEKPIFNTFYKTRGNLIEVNNKDFFIAVNPVFQFKFSSESNNSDKLFLNSRGISIRGMVSRKVGFHFYATDNQERDPLYVQRLINKFDAVPGAGFYKSFKTNGVDYFDLRGGVSWNVAKFIDMQFGYDKNFIGNGFRSVYLSDFSNNALYLKFNTRIGKFNYQNLFMELIPQFAKKNELLARKYFRMNHLSLNVTKWLNIGIFDAVMFGRKDRFDFMYLNPVLFLRASEQQVGSPDNALLGVDFKANIAKRIQVYGNLNLDEFKLSELKNNTGWWANKYGYQLGFKYIDVLGIKNTDIQLETNRIRPFTYSHFDSIANYTNYNLPLAHPLGANLQEYVAIIRSQPFKKLYLDLKTIYYFQGADSAGRNFGSNPFLNYNTRPREYGFNVGSGEKVTCFYTALNVAYEIKENLFFEVGVTFRDYKAPKADEKTTIISAGIRWNMARRDFDF
jgi:hypothetical protein